MVKGEANIKGDSGREEAFTPNEVSRRLGTNIKLLREAKSKLPHFKLTQEKMGAELWGVSAPRMNRIEKGKENLSLKKIIDLANYFGVDVYRLFIKPGTVIIKEEK